MLGLDENTLRHAAIEGGDWPFAALCVLAHPAAARLPRVALEDMARLVFEAGEPSELDIAKVRSASAFVDRMAGGGARV